MKKLIGKIKFMWVVVTIVGINILLATAPFLLERVKMESNISRLFSPLVMGLSWIDGLAIILGVVMMLIGLSFIVLKRPSGIKWIGKGLLLLVISFVLVFGINLVLGLFSSPTYPFALPLELR